MKVVGMLSLVTLLAAGTAVAMPSNHWGPGSFGDAGTLLNQLIYPCQAGCYSTENTCIETAASAALTAIENPTTGCSTEITAAKTACDTTSMSPACKSAVSALRTCAKSDLQTYHSAVSTCRGGLDSCLDTSCSE